VSGVKKWLVCIVVVVVTVGAIALALHNANISKDKVYSWRYKMTVEIETPEGVRTGSSVREVQVVFRPTGNTHPNDSKYDSHRTMKGEAVVVDLGARRGIVFATLSTSQLNLPFNVFEGPPGLTIEGAEYYSQLQNVKAKLSPTHYPRLITFTDINDPLSVKSLLEKEHNNKWPREYKITEDNFEKYLGAGVRLKSISIEMTDEPVIYKIIQFIPWVQQYRNKFFDGRTIHTIDAEDRLLNSLGTGSFTTYEADE
tara:strand:+ start:263 stop:1027 length:765 start_codon:yes stop_codon:yes gene_type:complete